MAKVNKFSLTNFLKKAQLNFKSSNQGLLGNKYLLYFILFIVISDLFIFATAGEISYIIIFIIVAFITKCFSKNMIVILTIAMVITNIIKYGTSIRNKESFMTTSSKKKYFDSFSNEEKEYLAAVSNGEVEGLEGLSEEESAIFQEMVDFANKNDKDSDEDDEVEDSEEEVTEEMDDESEETVKEKFRMIEGFKDKMKKEGMKNMKKEPMGHKKKESMKNIKKEPMGHKKKEPMGHKKKDPMGHKKKESMEHKKETMKPKDSFKPANLSTKPKDSFKNIEGLEKQTHELMTTQDALLENMKKIQPMLTQAESFMKEFNSAKK